MIAYLIECKNSNLLITNNILLQKFNIMLCKGIDGSEINFIFNEDELTVANFTQEYVIDAGEEVESQ